MFTPITFFYSLTCLLGVGDGQGQSGGVPVTHQPVRRPHVEVRLLRVSENSARQCAWQQLQAEFRAQNF